MYLERDGRIATVVLNNPERLNALGFTMWMRLGEVVRELDADDGVRCILLRGAIVAVQRHEVLFVRPSAAA